MTLGLLVTNLREFANFYEQYTRIIESVDVYEKTYHIGARDANAHDMREGFRATNDMGRIRTVILSRFGEELTISTALRLLGEVLKRAGGRLTTEQAEAMTLGEVANLFEEPASKSLTRTGGKAIQRDKKTEARDKWIYQECCKGTPHDTIVAELKKRAARKGVVASSL